MFNLSCIEGSDTCSGPIIIRTSEMDVSVDELIKRPVGTKRKLQPLPSSTVGTTETATDISSDPTKEHFNDFKISSNTKTVATKIPKKSLFLSITPQMTAEQIIKQEIKYLKKSERKKIYKVVLEMIAKNNIEDFDEILVIFLQEFGLSRLRDFKFNECCDYIYRFMILFGADNFAKKFGTHRQMYETKIKGLLTIESFGYLIANRPIDSVLSVLTGFSQLEIPEDMAHEIRNTINEKYPHLDLFRKALVNSIGLTLHDSWKIFLEPISDLEKLKMIAKETYITHFNTAIPIIVDLVLEVPELYVQCSFEEKIKFIRMAILNDSLEKLQKLLELDPEMVMFRDPGITKTRLGKMNKNIIDECIMVVACKCFRFLVQTFPEIAIVPDELDNHSIMRAVIVNRRDFLIILHEIGYSFTVNFKYKEFKNMNLVSLAFYHNLQKAMNYFLSELGQSSFVIALKAVWPTIIDLIKFIIKDEWNSSLVLFVMDKLRISLCGPFDHNGESGDARIFLSSSSSPIAKLLNARLEVDDLQMPIENLK